MSFQTVLKRSDDWKGYTADMLRASKGTAGRVSPPVLPAPPEKTFQGTCLQGGSSASKHRPHSPPFLDSDKHNCNRPRRPRCGCRTLAGTSKDGTGRKLFVRLACKAWRCGVCGPKKAKRLKFAIGEAAEKRGLHRLMSLTLDRHHCRAEDSEKYIRLVWRKFRVCLKRKLGGSVTFISVLEFQKAGYAHLHVLVGSFIAQSWIREAWSGVGGGTVVDIRHVDLHRVRAYLTKYLTKEALVGQYGRRYRRYTTSQDVTLFEKRDAGMHWTLWDAPLELFLRETEGRRQSERYDSDLKLASFETIAAQN